MSTFMIVALICVVAIFFGLRHGGPRPSPSGRAGGKESLPPMLDGNGDFDLEVVGESHYQAQLQRVAKGARRAEAIAVLELDDANPHDKKAVRVSIEGGAVGYLSREAARAFRKGVAKSAPGLRAFSCDAVIVGGKGKHYGVWLDIPVDEGE